MKAHRNLRRRLLLPRLVSEKFGKEDDYNSLGRLYDSTRSSSKAHIANMESDTGLCDRTKRPQHVEDEAEDQGDAEVEAYEANLHKNPRNPALQ
jgi:hypothetical protein